MRVLIATLGSIGDLMPFLAVAEALRRRGHDVVIGSNAGYSALVQRAGFDFHPIWNGTPAPIDDLLEQAPEQAWECVRRDLFAAAAEPTARFIRQFGKPSDCVMLAAWSAFAAPEICAAMGLPLHRVCLSPHAIDQAMAEPGFGKSAPQSWLGFFPEWFCAPRSGWPQIRLTGFPALDDSMVPPLERRLEDFLAAGPPPLIFTPGSYQRRSARFFRESLAACRKLQQRAIFLTPYADQAPAGLGPDALHMSYAPLARLAGRAALLVHHGGVGTLAEGLRAGVPHIAVPLFFDQFDNGERLRALGVGRVLPARDYDAASLTPVLEELLADSAVRERCRQIKALFQGGNPADAVCDLIESSMHREAPPQG